MAMHNLVGKNETRSIRKIFCVALMLVLYVLCDMAFAAAPAHAQYVLNANSKKFHITTCTEVSKIKPKNRKNYAGTRQSVIAQGYKPCKKCKP